MKPRKQIEEQSWNQLQDQLSRWFSNRSWDCADECLWDLLQDQLLDPLYRELKDYEA